MAKAKTAMATATDYNRLFNAKFGKCNKALESATEHCKKAECSFITVVGVAALYKGATGFATPAAAAQHSAAFVGLCGHLEGGTGSTGYVAGLFVEKGGKVVATNRTENLTYNQSGFYGCAGCGKAVTTGNGSVKAAAPKAVAWLSSAANREILAKAVNGRAKQLKLDLTVDADTIGKVADRFAKANA